MQYRSATGTSAQVTSLTGSVPAHGHYLVQEAAGSTASAALPAPDATGNISMSGSNGVVLLAPSTTAFTATGNLAGNPGLLDMVGYGTTPTSYETAATGVALTNTTSAARTATGTDTDNNADDFSEGAPAPENSGGVQPPPPDTTTATIAEIQGTGATSPLSGQTVQTTGVVTAAYPAGGLNGFYLQTAGTGGASDPTPGASDAVFVYLGSAATYPAVGDFVEVIGAVSEFKGASDTGTTLTEVSPGTTGSVTVLPDAHDPVTALATAYPTTEADREAHEGELLAPTDEFTVTDNYSTNQYAEIGLATGDHPLIQWTDVARPSTPEAQVVKDDNARRAVTLDDGASINFLSTANNRANMNIPLPWLTPSNTIRVGATATLHEPVVLDYRNSIWKFQPTHQVTDAGAAVATFEETREAAPAAVPGNLHLATFNVLNYFNTTGEAFVAADPANRSCTYYTDRELNRVTDNSCTPDGPRGAAQDDDLARQQAKIVAAINSLGADIVSLEEVENSVKLGEPDRDDAISALVAALNQAAGSTRWAYAPSPAAADLPALSEQDVIRSGFIYNPDAVDLVGPSQVLVGSAAFANAREPLAQAFKVHNAPDTQAFAVVVNHFKSKGGDPADGSGNADSGDGQGAWNASRVAQADALAAFADEFSQSRNTDKVLLSGDFNSYTREDPMQELYDAGYTAVVSDTAGEATYSFDGMVGSLDHVLANPAALGLVAGADVWNINSVESVAFEYSRTNYNVTDFFEPNVFRASDHDPEIVGLTLAAALESTTVDAQVPSLTYGTAASIPVTVTSGTPAGGTVTLREGGTALATAEVVDGSATLDLSGTALAPGQHDLTFDYSGDAGHAASSAATSATVARATSAVAASVSPATIKVKRGTAWVSVQVTATGVLPTGQVGIFVDGVQQGVATLSNGAATLTIGPFSTTGVKTFEVRYLGSSFVLPGSVTRTVTVTKGSPN